MLKFRHLAVDATPIISAIIGGKAIEVFSSSKVGRLLTTNFTIHEVEEKIPKVAKKNKLKKAGITEREMKIALATLPVEAFPRSFYEDHLEDASDRIEDPKDVDLLALALKFQASIWTNDRHFENCGLHHIDTAKLLKALSDA